MSRHEDKPRLRDMLEHARVACDAAKVRSRGDLDADPVFRAACERFIEIIGEAAAGVLPGFKDRHPEIPWREIIGTRNVLVHAYARIDLDVLWTILDQDLPELIAKLEDLLRS